MTSVKHVRSIVLLLFSTVLLFAQNKITGKVIDAKTGEPIFLANVVVKGKLIGAATNFDGVFEITGLSSSESVTLEVHTVGYRLKEIPNVSGDVGTIEIEEEIYGETVVVTASRKSESVLESAVTIEKMDLVAIKNAPKANFYEAVASLKAIDVTSSSMAMPVINMRGFNSTSPDRIVQFVDGMDNQAPALNFPVGNMVGMSELDIESVEIIYGAASSLYGPNAFNGVISMKSKSPWEFPGVSARIKSGSRGLFDGAVRYAAAYDNKFAFKINAAFMQADDWIADHPVNNYGTGKVNLKMNDVLQEYDQVAGHPLAGAYSQTQQINGLFQTFGVNNSMTLDDVAVTPKSYAEKDIVDYDTRNLKLNSSFHYRLSDNEEFSYNFNYGDGTGVYQGANRYSLKNLSMQQHKLQYDKKGKNSNYTLKAYKLIDDAGDSYDSFFTSVNLNKRDLTNYTTNYLSRYLGYIAGNFNSEDLNGLALADPTSPFFDPGYATNPTFIASLNALNTLSATINTAKAAAAGVELGYLKPGTPEFDQAFKEITESPDIANGGSRFTDNSSVTHFEGQIDTKVSDMSVIAGASYRIYDPESNGSIFRDGDWQSDANDNVSKSLGDISVSEMGTFVQVEKKFLDDRLKATFAGRYDKHENFDAQFSPRASFVYSLKSDKGRTNNGNLRFSYQTAFRNPSLQDQYIGLDVVQAYLWGNHDGFNRGYQIKYVRPDGVPLPINPFVSGDTPTKQNLDPVKPEKVASWEVGYKSIFWEKVFVDLNYYESDYTDFIQAKNVLVPHGDNIANFSSGGYKVYQVDSNSDEEVSAYGFSMSGNYYVTDNFILNGNYTRSELDAVSDESNVNAYNTPKHKWNIGLTGRNLSGFGFNINMKHVDGFKWEGSTIFTGWVPEYDVVDVSVLYDFKFSGQKMSAKLAISNAFDEEYFSAFGTPNIGRLAIFQLSTEF